MFIKSLNKLVLILIIGILLFTISIFGFAAEEISILDRIIKDKVMIVGLPPNTVNWHIVNPETGKWEGICVDIMDNLAEQMEVKVEYKAVDWQAFPMELENGSIDVFAGTATYTVPRSMVVAYTYPIFWKGLGFITLTKNADKYKSMEDINKEGVRIAVGIGTSEDQQAKYYFPKANTLRMKTGSHSELVEAVRAGQADLAVFGHLNAWDFDKEFDDLTMPIKAVSPALHSFIVKYGDWKWLSFLDTYCMQVSRSGLVDQIAKKWFPEMPDEVRDITP